MRMKLIRLLFSGLILALAGNAYGNETDTSRLRKWYLPHYIPIQFAGNVGFLSTGIGYTSKALNYNLEVLYGYVPRSAGGEVIHTVTAKNYFPFGRFPLKNRRSLIPYLGIGLSMEIGGNSFFIQPRYFPDSYYDFPKNLHVIAYGGARVQHMFEKEGGVIRGVEFFAEGGTVDVYIWYKAISSQIKFHQIFTLAIGGNLLLKR